MFMLRERLYRRIFRRLIRFRLIRAENLNSVFVTKINAAGNAIVYSTYIGGSGGAIGHGIDTDNAGNVYVTGTTGSGFPTTPNAFDTGFNGTDDAFLLKINAGGSALSYSTYLGGNNTDIGFEVKVNKTTGEAFVAGNALSDNFPTTPGAFRTACAPTPCVSGSYVTKLNAAGSALVYSTYIGAGPANDLAIDANGNAYIVGQTISQFFPVTPGAVQPTCTGCNLSRSDAFVTKLNPTGSALVYSTYLGGSIDDVGTSIAVMPEEMHSLPAEPNRAAARVFRSRLRRARFKRRVRAFPTPS